VRILQSISNAISAAASVKSKALSTLPITPAELLKAGAKPTTKDAGAGEPWVLVTVTEYIPPGVYRLQKPSELTCCPEKGTGFLTELGIPTETDRKVQLVQDPTPK